MALAGKIAGGAGSPTAKTRIYLSPYKRMLSQLLTCRGGEDIGSDGPRARAVAPATIRRI